MGKEYSKINDELKNFENMLVSGYESDGKRKTGTGLDKSMNVLWQPMM